MRSLVFLFIAAPLFAQCGLLVLNPTTGKLDCAGAASASSAGFSPTPQTVTSGVTTSVVVPFNGTILISQAVPSCVSTAGVGFEAGGFTNTTTQMTLTFSPSAPATGTCTAILSAPSWITVSAGDPGCTTTAHVGKIWFDVTTTTTAVKFCMNVAGVLTWVTK